MTAALLAPGTPSARADAIFGAGVAGTGFAQFPQWGSLLTRAHNDGDDEPISAPARKPRTDTPDPSALPPTDCTNDCARAIWTTFLQSIAALPARAQIDAVNRWANAKPYIEDWMNWGVSDYWETPPEFVRRGGDCEDFAIAKYFSLIRLGFSPADLRVVTVYDRNLKASHAVLAVRFEDETLLLDIVTSAIVPLARARHYAPVYALGETGWWLYPAPPFAGHAAAAPKQQP